MQELLRDLKKHHHDVAGRIIGSEVVDEHHLTEDPIACGSRRDRFRTKVMNCRTSPETVNAVSNMLKGINHEHRTSRTEEL